MIFALKLAGYALTIYGLFLLLLFFMQGRLLFAPDPNTYTQDQVGVSGYYDFHVTTQDGLKLTGWHSPARNGKPTIIMLHGNASTYQWRARDFIPLIDAGYGVLLAGYRGYGGNPGTPSEDGLYKDADAYLSALSLPRDKIVLYGESLGTGVAVEMATRHKGIKALILEVPYSSITEVANFHYPYVLFMDVLLKNKFDSLNKIDRLTTPKLILLAGQDRVIPTQFGQRLFDRAAEPKTLKIYDNAAHSDVRSMGGIDDVRTFLDQIN